MKKIFAISAIAIAAATMAFTFSDVLPIGSAMPKADVKLKAVSGKEVTMKETKDKNGVLVMFSCNTCPYVVKNQERTFIISKYAAANHVGVIILNSNEAQRGDADSYAAMKKYAADQNYQWQYVVDADNQIADAFGANRTPECFLFDKDLKLTYHGAIDDNPSDPSNVSKTFLKDAIDATVSGKEVVVKESKSVGCSIKRKS